MPDWDDTFLSKVLQIMRSDPACAHGYAPAQLLLGRPLVYPFELDNMEVDVSGKNFSKLVVIC